LARFLFTVWPFAGHVHPAIGIAHALRTRGHEVAFYTGATVRSLVEYEGFRFFPFANVDERKISTLVATEFPYEPSLWKQIRRARRFQAKFREWLLDTVPQQVLDIEEVLTAWCPDVIVCDSAFWSPILVLGETEQIRVAVLSVTAACILPGPDAPSWGRGAPRPRNRMMRARYALERRLVRWLSAPFRKQVNAVRRSYSLLPLKCSVTEFAGTMPLYLIPSTREYDYERRDLPASVHYVGPCLWDKPAGEPPPDWLTQLSGNRPLLYVTEATIGIGTPFLAKAAVFAFRDGPFQVVITTGKQRDPAELKLGAPAPNIRVERYVPQSDLLPRAAVMVTLGGSGGVLAALMAGVPLVVVPTEWDRQENAQRVVECGAGLRIAANRCTPERLRAAVDRVLAEPSFRRNARRLGDALKGSMGPARAAQLLEGLTSEGSGTELSPVAAVKGVN
jgi:MGT family glycosyltransferase